MVMIFIFTAVLVGILRLRPFFLLLLEKLYFSLNMLVQLQHSHFLSLEIGIGE